MHTMCAKYDPASQPFKTPSLDDEENGRKRDPWKKSLNQICRENWAIPEYALEGLETVAVPYVIGKSQFMAMRHHFKDFIGNQQALNIRAYKAYLLFGTTEKLEQYATKSREINKTRSSAAEIMACTHFPPAKLWSQINFRAWGDAFIAYGLRRTNGVFLTLSPDINPVRNETGHISLRITEFNHIAGVRHHSPELTTEIENLMALSIHFKKNSKEFKRALDYWQEPKNDVWPEPDQALPEFRIPGRRFGMPGASFTKLSPDDQRILFLGDFTNCCERVTDNKFNLEKNVAYTINNKREGYYVVEIDGEIIAHSWAFRGTNGELIFDGFESDKNLFTIDHLQKLLSAVTVETTVNERLGHHLINGILIGHCADHLSSQNFYYNIRVNEVKPKDLANLGMTQQGFHAIITPLMHGYYNYIDETGPHLG